MAYTNSSLPQQGGTLFLTDGGLETTLIFHDGIELPYFASFDLLRTQEGTARLRAYYERYIAIAKARGTGFILEAPTWRASADWGRKLGYSAEALVEVNRAAIELMKELRDAHASARMPMVVSGNLGPRGDAYAPGALMSAGEAEAYHAPQARSLADAGAEMIAAFTLGYADEAIGIVRAIARTGLPSAISFTLETDGRLPSGQGLGEAIMAVDAATGGAPAYYMINCAHPTHFDEALKTDAAWLKRIGGLRANASMRSHAELDEAPDLDAGDPADLGRRYAALCAALPQLTVLGGCCGTDHRHVEEIGTRIAVA